MHLHQLMNYTMTISDQNGQPTVQKGLCEVNQFHTPFHHLKVVAFMTCYSGACKDDLSCGFFFFWGGGGYPVGCSATPG